MERKHKGSVHPDIEIYPTIKGIKNEHDELLEKATD